MGKSKIARWLCGVGCCTWLSLVVAQAQLPSLCFTNVHDFTYMWWHNGWRGEKVLDFQSSRYFLSFDFPRLAINSLRPMVQPVAAAAALTQTNSVPGFTQYSDTFELGNVGQSLSGAPLNNMLGGTSSAAWITLQNTTYQLDGTDRVCQSEGARCLINQVLENDRPYQLKVRVKPPPGKDGQWTKFSGLVLRANTNDLGFWATSGLTLRFFNASAPAFDAFYDSTSGKRIWLARGALGAEDFDADGYYRVTLDFSGAGTPASPLQVSLRIKGALKKTYSITDLKGGAFAGLSGGYAPARYREVQGLTLRENVFTCVLENNGARYKATSASASASDCRLIESGKFFQRRWLPNLTFAAGAPALYGEASGLEIAAWPDRVAFIWRVNPSVSLVRGAMELQLKVPELYAQARGHGPGAALSAEDLSGFVFLPYPATADLSVDSAKGLCTVRLAPGTWAAGVEKTVGLIVYPSAASQALLPEAVEQETRPLLMGAQQIAPKAQALPVAYKPEYGWHQVDLQLDANLDNLKRVILSVTNISSTPKTLRLNFARDGSVPGITGISAMLRDADRQPLGIPVQLSKNWHKGTSGARFYGPWFHGFTMLTVPAQTVISFEYTHANAYWGWDNGQPLPAASHAQLSLVGWGGNQLWDQAAIGSWGEQITFDPDVGLGRSMIDDVRPVHVWSMNQNTPVARNWCNNIGGGDFLVYYNEANVKQWNSRMRTHYYRYGPKLTEVVYSGCSQDGKIELQCTASVIPSDDFARVRYRLRYDVKQRVRFSRLAFFQLGADAYNDHVFNKIARGNATGLVEEWSPAKGTLSYSRAGIPCTGQTPWFSLHEAVSKDRSTYGAWANRGLIIRSWNARLGGAPAPIPYAATYGTKDSGYASANVELSAPPGVNELQPGDFVEVELEQLTLPQYAADYYGSNTNFLAALKAGQNTWRLVRREAVGNDLEVNVTLGTLESVYPLRVRADQNGHAEFTVTGGHGYVPMTIGGLPGYRRPVLLRQETGWEPVNQSRFGSDFWQTDYEDDSQSWAMTYSVPLDSPGDRPQPTTFRFYLGETIAPVTAPNQPSEEGGGAIPDSGSPPALAMEISNGTLLLRWPSAAPFYRVFVADSLQPPVRWEPLAIPWADDGTWKTIYLPLRRDEPARFFRLSNE